MCIEMRFRGDRYRMTDPESDAGLSKLWRLPRGTRGPSASRREIPRWQRVACTGLLRLPHFRSMTVDVEFVSLDIEKALGHYLRAEGGAA